MRGTIFVLLALLAAVALMIAGCGQQEPSAPEIGQGASASSLAKKSADDIENSIQLMMEKVNAKAAAEGKNVMLAVVEYMTPDDAEEAGRTVYFRNLGNKQLASHWVPFDPRRFGSSEIYWANDVTEGTTSSGLTQAQTGAAIANAMQTWNGVQCSTIPLVQVPDYGLDLGYVQFLYGFGGVPGWLADVTHAGWLPGAFFDAVAAGGGSYILGVTFTFIWTDGFNPTDIDNNKKFDVAFREIYYNDNFSWANGSTYDVETVSLHEMGHGLSQAHFGTAFRDAGAGKLHFSPRAVMNAAYSGVQTEIGKTDNAGHCSIWASWPN